MYHDVLVPTDGSPGAAAAVDRALDIASTFDATVHALSVVDTGTEPPGVAPDDREAVRNHLETRSREATVRLTDRASDRGLETVREVREGSPHRAILEYAAAGDVDLIVMGTRGGADGDGRPGSTTERVIGLADVPVLAVPPGTADLAGVEPGYGAYDHVLLATDGSDPAGRAADHALAIAERYGADVHAVYVVDTSIYGLQDAPRSVLGPLKQGGRAAVDELAAAARDRNLPVTTDVLRGVPEEALREYAAGVGADLIALGTRGRGGWTDPLLGSTTARLLGRAETPVLTVR
jgi:nucleotide-binding universal stress UspA family protein